jgi:hypothetical protein
MINATTLPLMRKDAVLINTARGAIVDTDALWTPCAPMSSRVPVSTYCRWNHPADDAMASAYRGRADQWLVTAC